MVAFQPEADRVTARLRDEIVDGRRRPGAKLVERTIAAELGVSRVPVREALRNLIAEGLATARPRTWTVVATFGPRDIEDLMEVRSALEVLTVRLAAERRTEADVRCLREHLERGRRAAECGDSGTARRAGADFHEELTRIAGNSVLLELSEITRSRMRWLLGQHGDLLPMVIEHAAIFGAVADADPDRAVDLAHAHLVSSRRAALALHAGHAGA